MEDDGTAVGIVLAGGDGSRAALGHNKVLARLGDRTVLERSIDAVAAAVDAVVVVTRAQDRAAVATLVAGRVAAVVDGGATRHDSEVAGIVAARRVAKVPTIRLVSTKQPPELNIVLGLTWHLFNSHIW